MSVRPVDCVSDHVASVDSMSVRPLDCVSDHVCKACRLCQ